MTKNYCNDHKDKEFEDVPPKFSGDSTVKWKRCIECGYHKQVEDEKK